MNNQKKMSLTLFMAWLLAMLSITGSLFFSEIMEFPPCSLCWYQRILMYPLGIILLIAFWLNDHQVFKYAFPLSFLGLIASLYHNLLTWEIIPETLAPCREGVSCATTYIDWFGFMTIPLLSLVAFSLISILLIFYKKTKR